MTSSKRINHALVEYIQRESWNEVNYILNNYYSKSGGKNTKKRLLDLLRRRKLILQDGILLLACSKCAPLDVIEHMHSLSPEQIQVRDSESGWYSITFAIKARAPEDVIKFLAENFPLALTSPDIYKMQTPLHAACEQGVSSNLIRILCENGKAACGMECSEGRTPMEVAILSQDMDARVLDFLHKSTSQYWNQRRRSDESFRTMERKSKPQYGSSGSTSTATTSKAFSRMNSPSLLEAVVPDCLPEFIQICTGGADVFVDNLGI